VNEPPKPANRARAASDEPRRLSFSGAAAEAPHRPATKNRSRRSAPAANSDRDRYWPRDAPIRWGALFGGAMKQATLIVALVVHVVLGLVLIADLGLGLGPPGRYGTGADWLIALAYGALSVVTIRGFLLFRWTVLAGPVGTLALLAIDERFPFA